MSEMMIQQKPFEPHYEMLDGRPILIRDDHGTYEDHEKYLKKPTRIHLNETMQVFSSYIEAVSTRFDKNESAIYTRLSRRDKYDDFYFAGFAKDCRNGDPNWRGDFTIGWDANYTIKARDWLQHDEADFSQESFALFLDKHINDIRCVDSELQKSFPTQMELFNFVSTLQDSKSDRFTRKVNIQNGDVTVSLERESDDGTKQQLKLFERFPLVLQIYEGFPTYQVTAKLRFRIRDGHVTFWYDIEGLEEMFIAARTWAVEELKKTGIPVYI